MIILAGDRYVDPLLERDVFKPSPWDTTFPFKDHEFQGIGEQMQWLTEEADCLEQYQAEQINTGDSVELGSADVHIILSGRTEVTPPEIHLGPIRKLTWYRMLSPSSPVSVSASSSINCLEAIV